MSRISVENFVLNFLSVWEKINFLSWYVFWPHLVYCRLYNVNVCFFACFSFSLLLMYFVYDIIINKYRGLRRLQTQNMQFVANFTLSRISSLSFTNYALCIVFIECAVTRRNRFWQWLSRMRFDSFWDHCENLFRARRQLTGQRADEMRWEAAAAAAAGDDTTNGIK